MSKFIEVVLEPHNAGAPDSTLLLNVDHIASILKRHEGGCIIKVIHNNYFFQVKNEYSDIIKLLKEQYHIVTPVE